MRWAAPVSFGKVLAPDHLWMHPNGSMDAIGEQTHVVATCNDVEGPQHLVRTEPLASMPMSSSPAIRTGYRFQVYTI